MEHEVFELETGGWAYRVGSVYQEYHPDKEGFQPMTQEEATTCALIIAARMA